MPWPECWSSSVHKLWLCWSFNGVIVPGDPGMLESCLANHFPTALPCEVLKSVIYLRNKNMLEAITLFTATWLLALVKTSKWGPLVLFFFTDLNFSIYHCPATRRSWGGRGCKAAGEKAWLSALTSCQPGEAERAGGEVDSSASIL